MEGTPGAIIIGSANADLVVRVDRHPAPGETVLGSDLEIHPGGKGANQAVAAARLGTRTALAARIGTDPHGDLILEALKSASVDTSAVLRDDHTPTGVALITVSRTGENAIVVSPGANAHLTAADAATAVRQATPWATVVSAQLEIPPEAAAAAAQAAERHGARFLLNPSPPDPLLDKHFANEVLPLCDPLIVNESEARLLLRQDTPDPARDLLELGARSAVVTLGARGAVVAREDAVTAIPGIPVKAVDTTGAGDAFTGALAWRLCRHPDLVEAAHWAVRAGAAAVRARGAQSAYPTADNLPGA